MTLPYIEECSVTSHWLLNSSKPMTMMAHPYETWGNKGRIQHLDFAGRFSLQSKLSLSK
jgi:hypothetical protein